jgi:subtilisin family serine protease
VDFVVHDRMVYAHQTVARSLRPVNAPGISSGILVAIGDGFYRGPEGWAVRQVGGYGKGMPGGPVRGPWDVTTGAGVRIAVLDSGIDAHHPDLAPNLVLNLSEIDQTPMSGLPSACDDGTPQDQQGHGTWVASLAAGALGPGTGDVAGVAPSASLLNIKVLERMPDTTVAGAARGCDQHVAGFDDRSFDGRRRGAEGALRSGDVCGVAGGGGAGGGGGQRRLRLYESSVH